MANIPKIIEHLRNRPFAPILEKLDDDELNGEIALKFMCIVDYEVEKRNLYARIRRTNFPKLLHELLGFYSYKKFRFYEYADNSHFINKQLQCKFGQCQFVGPYALVLTHMAISHNMHFSFILCAYCCKCDLKKHIDENSLQICYEKYLDREDIGDVATEIPVVRQIILDFYAMLKECSKRLGVRVKRQWNYYAGKGFGRPELLPMSYGNGISTQIIAYQPKQAAKSFSTIILKQEFESVMKIFDGPSDPSRFINMPPNEAGATADPFVMDEQRPSTSGMRISSVTSLHDRSNTASAMSTQSSGMCQSHLEDVDPFMRYVNNRFQGIQDKKRRRKLENTFLNELRKAEDEEEDSQ